MLEVGGGKLILERINQVLPFIAAKEWLVGLFTYVLIAKREAR